MDALVAVAVPLTVGWEGERPLEGRVSAAASRVLPDPEIQRALKRRGELAISGEKSPSCEVVVN